MDLTVVIPLGGAGVASAGTVIWLLNQIYRGIQKQNGDIRKIGESNEKLAALAESTVELARQQQRLVDHYQDLVGRACAEHREQAVQLRHIDDAVGAVHRRLDDR